MTSSLVAAAEQVAPPTVTKVISKLEAAGLVDRVVDPSDRRVSRVALSAAGRRQVEENRSRRTAWLADRVGEPSAEERERLANAVDVIEHLTTARRAEVQ